MPTIIKPCTCIHPFQDQLYGPHQRVHNGPDPNPKESFRCTVCNTTTSKK